MLKVKLYLQNTNKLSYHIVHEGLSGKKISSEIQFTQNPRGADVVLDCVDLHSAEQFEKVKEKIFREIWDVYNRINAPLQKRQKKIRLNNRLN